jgi:hypothetical protein
MWGAPGTLLAAVFLHERTGESRWAELFCDTADALWSQLEWSAECGCRFWTQDLYGRRRTYLDAVHGFVATASPLIRGRALLGEAAWTRWHEVIVETVGRSATREGPHVNWRPQRFDPPGRGSASVVQFCHGAPGFVVCLGDLPGDELDELLLGAGETTWAAGPLAKGPGLCHGTAGNGYAFLKLHRRTGDARWLARARAFAMHAIAQSERDGPRASLWTGDLGVALYLRACLDGDARFLGGGGDAGVADQQSGHAQKSVPFVGRSAGISSGRSYGTPGAAMRRPGGLPARCPSEGSACETTSGAERAAGNRPR